MADGSYFRKPQPAVGGALVSDSSDAGLDHGAQAAADRRRRERDRDRELRRMAAAAATGGYDQSDSATADEVQYRPLAKQRQKQGAAPAPVAVPVRPTGAFAAYRPHRRPAAGSDDSESESDSLASDSAAANASGAAAADDTELSDASFVAHAGTPARPPPALSAAAAAAAAAELAVTPGGGIASVPAARRPAQHPHASDAEADAQTPAGRARARAHNLAGAGAGVGGLGATPRPGLRRDTEEAGAKAGEAGKHSAPMKVPVGRVTAASYAARDAAAATAATAATAAPAAAEENKSQRGDAPALDVTAANAANVSGAGSTLSKGAFAGVAAGDASDDANDYGEVVAADDDYEGYASGDEGAFPPSDAEADHAASLAKRAQTHAQAQGRTGSSLRSPDEPSKAPSSKGSVLSTPGASALDASTGSAGGLFSGGAAGLPLAGLGYHGAAAAGVPSPAAAKRASAAAVAAAAAAAASVSAGAAEKDMLDLSPIVAPPKGGKINPFIIDSAAKSSVAASHGHGDGGDDGADYGADYNDDDDYNAADGQSAVNTSRASTVRPSPRRSDKQSAVAAASAGDYSEEALDAYVDERSSSASASASASAGKKPRGRPPQHERAGEMYDDDDNYFRPHLQGAKKASKAAAAAEAESVHGRIVFHERADSERLKAGGRAGRGGGDFEARVMARATELAAARLQATAALEPAQPKRGRGRPRKPVPTAEELAVAKAAVTAEVAEESDDDDGYDDDDGASRLRRLPGMPSARDDHGMMLYVGGYLIEQEEREKQEALERGDEELLRRSKRRRLRRGDLPPGSHLVYDAIPNDPLSFIAPPLVAVEPVGTAALGPDQREKKPRGVSGGGARRAARTNISSPWWDTLATRTTTRTTTTTATGACGRTRATQRTGTRPRADRAGPRPRRRALSCPTRLCSGSRTTRGGPRSRRASRRARCSHSKRWRRSCPRALRSSRPLPP